MFLNLYSSKPLIMPVFSSPTTSFACTIMILSSSEMFHLKMILIISFPILFRFS